MSGEVELSLTTSNQVPSADIGIGGKDDDGDEGEGEETKNGRGNHNRNDGSGTYQRIISPELEEVFCTMQYRKMQRELNGPQKKKTKYHYIALACLLILVYGLSAYNKDISTGDIQVTLYLPVIIGFGAWFILSIIIISLLSDRVQILFCWMVIYWPLLAVLSSMLYESGHWSIVIATIVLEVITLFTFLFVNYVYPKFVTSKWFKENYGATRFWRITLVGVDGDDGSEDNADDNSNWTMEYDGRFGCFGKRYECRYIGELNEEGLPHGRGVWSDNSYNGEVLTGMWVDGKPIGPFSSRQYGGHGSTFSSIRIAFFMATDDPFEENKLIPTNAGPPRVGVASVECSIAGEFFSHLPEATLLVEPQTDGDGITIGDCVCKADDINTSDDNKQHQQPVQTLQINCNDPRGVQIVGHRYETTGLPFTKRIKQIIIDIGNVDEKGSKYEPLDVIDNTTTDNYDQSRDVLQQQQQEEDDEDDIENNDQYAQKYTMHLDVRKWTTSGSKDTALIFIPGYNSWLKHSAESFGQVSIVNAYELFFRTVHSRETQNILLSKKILTHLSLSLLQMLSMSKLSSHVHPIIYAYPGAKVFTYRWASYISATKNNQRYFLQMLKGLQREGIQNIHILTHSLGVQSLMNAFEENIDGTLSPISELFGSAPTTHSSNNYKRNSMVDAGKLVCRSITMMNPDFPTLAFRERAFRSIRRITSLITIIGDTTDQALFWSSTVNGALNLFGLPQPSLLDSKAKKQQKGYHVHSTIGRHLHALYVEGDNNGNDDIVISRRSRASSEDSKHWLDCDVIDTAMLDTNVNDLRHAAFSMNSILIRDIEELVVTGKRAANRTSLLHKKGNVYEYCHAPSFVKPE